jgi:hypothetical protein
MSYYVSKCRIKPTAGTRHAGLRIEEGNEMEELKYRSWEEFKKSEYRRCGTFQLSVEDLANDLYFDDDDQWEDPENSELNFDY